MNSWQAAFAALPDNHRKAREGHLRAFLERGFPTRKDEDWRYTDLSPLGATVFAVAEPHAPRFSPLQACELLVFANGRHTGGDPALAGTGGAEAPAGPVASLNAAFAQSGLNLEVPAGQERAPLHVVTWFGGARDSMAHLRHRIRLHENARATVVFQELGDDIPFFATQVLDAQLGPGSRLDLVRLQSLGDHVSALSRFDVRLDRDAVFGACSLDRGGQMVRHDLNVVLEAPGACATLHGVLLPHAKEHLDVHTRIEHRAPHGTSREAFRAIVEDKARAVFNGKVIVHPDAVKTDSEQHVDTLLLAPGAEINAKPELEIYADDVKCAHGATCGQLDENAIYYLRSRGIPAPDARSVLLYAFAEAVLKKIPLPAARLEAERLLLSRLPGGAAGAPQ